MSFNYITQIDHNLRACISLENREKNVGYWRMRVHLYYRNKPAGSTSFNLHGYTQSEAEQVAKNFRHNAYLMREIDEFLWGESD